MAFVEGGKEGVDTPKKANKTAEYTKIECLLSGSTYDPKRKTCTFKNYTREECKKRTGGRPWCAVIGSKAYFSITQKILQCDWEKFFPGRCLFGEIEELKTPEAKKILGEIEKNYGEIVRQAGGEWIKHKEEGYKST